jgi:hypothetical protein
MRILELGNYIIPAYAGMILAEQGHEIVKLVHPVKPDPIQALRHGNDLWDWINEGKRIEKGLLPESLSLKGFDAVIENIRASTWQRWGCRPVSLAIERNVRWIGVRDELGGRSFDVIAQARAFGDFADRVPFYIGDTAVGLWAAFKLLSSGEPGFSPIYQSSALFKLVEGEMVVTTNAKRKRIAASKDFWDDNYGMLADSAELIYRGESISEPIRNHDWRWEHLHHMNGRIII